MQRGDFENIILYTKLAFSMKIWAKHAVLSKSQHCIKHTRGAIYALECCDESQICMPIKMKLQCADITNDVN